MDPTIASTIIGVLLTVAFGAVATMIAWLRSDLDKMDKKFDARLERLEAKVDGLILGLTRRGFLTGSEVPSGGDD